MQDKKTNQEKVGMGDKINEFIQRNRKGIFAAACVILILFAGSLVFIYVKDNLDKKAAAEIEELITKFDELREKMFDEEGNEEIDAFIAELEDFGEKTRGFPGSKAKSMAAEIYVIREDWSKAEEAFTAAARIGAKTYLGPISLFNAAVAAEEQSRLEEAIDLLEQALSHKFEFIQAPHAQFSVGRLNEQLGNYDEAIAAYREVLINWSDIQNWHLLARSRIIALEIKIESSIDLEDIAIEIND